MCSPPPSPPSSFSFYSPISILRRLQIEEGTHTHTGRLYLSRWRASDNWFKTPIIKSLSYPHPEHGPSSSPSPLLFLYFIFRPWLQLIHNKGEEGEGGKEEEEDTSQVSFLLLLPLPPPSITSTISSSDSSYPFFLFFFFFLSLLYNVLGISNRCCCCCWPLTISSVSSGSR